MIEKEKTFTIVARKDSVSDGYHTFADIYEHRHALTPLLMLEAAQ